MDVAGRMPGMIDRFSRRLFPMLMFLALLCLLPGQQALAADAASPAAAGPIAKPQVSSAGSVMQKFAGDDEVAPERKIDTKRKHQILFLMGISLLVLLFITGTMGVAMAAFGKDVFVAHMIFAGLSLTLAAAHAATSIAWFWPY